MGTVAPDETTQVYRKLWTAEPWRWRLQTAVTGHQTQRQTLRPQSEPLGTWGLAPERKQEKIIRHAACCHSQPTGFREHVDENKARFTEHIGDNKICFRKQTGENKACFTELIGDNKTCLKYI